MKMLMIDNAVDDRFPSMIRVVVVVIDNTLMMRRLIDEREFDGMRERPF